MGLMFNLLFCSVQIIKRNCWFDWSVQMLFDHSSNLSILLISSLSVWRIHWIYQITAVKSCHKCVWNARKRRHHQRSARNQHDVHRYPSYTSKAAHWGALSLLATLFVGPLFSQCQYCLKGSAHAVVLLRPSIMQLNHSRERYLIHGSGDGSHDGMGVS